MHESVTCLLLSKRLFTYLASLILLTYLLSSTWIWISFSLNSILVVQSIKKYLLMKIFLNLLANLLARRYFWRIPMFLHFGNSSLWIYSRYHIHLQYSELVYASWWRKISIWNCYRKTGLTIMDYEQSLLVIALLFFKIVPLEKEKNQLLKCCWRSIT